MATAGPLVQNDWLAGHCLAINVSLCLTSDSFARPITRGSKSSEPPSATATSVLPPQNEMGPLPMAPSRATVPARTMRSAQLRSSPNASLTGSSTASAPSSAALTGQSLHSQYQHQQSHQRQHMHMHVRAFCRCTSIDSANQSVYSIYYLRGLASAHLPLWRKANPRTVTTTEKIGAAKSGRACPC